MAYVQSWSHYQHKNPMPVRVRGRVFPSIEACAKHFNLHPKTVRNQLHAGNIDKVGLGRGKNPGAARFGANPRSRPVVLFGTEFPSLCRAAGLLKIPRPLVTRVVKGNPNPGDTEVLMLAHMKYTAVSCT